MADIVITKPEDIQAFRLLTLKSALSLECIGLRRSRGPSAHSIIKQEFGLKGNKEKVFAEFVRLLKGKGILEQDASEDPRHRKKKV